LQQESVSSLIHFEGTVVLQLPWNLLLQHGVGVLRYHWDAHNSPRWPRRMPYGRVFPCTVNRSVAGHSFL